LKTIDGRLVIVAGASRSGKTAWTEKQVRGERRLIVWDAEDQWSKLRGFRRVNSMQDLLNACRSSGPARLAYVPGGNLKEQFDFWAGCVLFWGRYYGPCVAVAEELADVTSSAKAPGKWGMVLRRGLKRGISIYAISQRWAEADKTCIGNASEFCLVRMSSGDDVAYMSRKTRVPVAELDKLKPLEYVRYSVTGDFERGKLRF
jgi:hypothetical protein